MFSSGKLLANARLVMENFLRYGFIIDITAAGSFIEDWTRWPATVISLSTTSSSQRISTYIF